MSTYIKYAFQKIATNNLNDVALRSNLTLAEALYLLHSSLAVHFNSKFHFPPGCSFCRLRGVFVDEEAALSGSDEELANYSGMLAHRFRETT